MARKSKFIGILVSVVLALSLVLVACAPAAPAKVYTMKSGHSVSPDSTRHHVYMNFAELCEKYSDGRLKVDVYPSAALYGDKDSLEACMAGAIQFVFQPVAEVGKLTPVADLLGGPGLYKDPEALLKFMKSKESREILADLKGKGLYPLGMNANGFRYIYMSNAKPIREPADLAGIKIRSWPAEYPRSMIEAVGGTPVIIAFAEVPTALHEGAVDAVFTSAASGYANKLHELTKYYATGTVLGPSPNFGLVNMDFWNSLPNDLQKVIDKAWWESVEFNYNDVYEYEGKAIEDMSKIGDMYLLDTAPNVDVWAETVEPVRDIYKAKVTAEQWELIKKGVGLK